MRVLVACEYSGIVREAFSRAGHFAVSCDLLPSEQAGNHYQGNVLDILNDNWDLMIAHPPCDKLSFSGNDYLNIDKYGEKAVLRYAQREKAMDFFRTLWNAPINKICIENPIGYPIQLIKHTQVIHPYFFGDCNMKRTALWLKNLPPLYHTKQDTLFETKTHTDYPKPIYIGKKNIYRTSAIGGKNKDAAKERAKFFPKVAEAMATQWSE